MKHMNYKYLNRVQSVFSTLSAYKTTTSLLQASGDIEGGVVLGGQTSADPQHVRDTGILVGLIASSCLDNNAQRGHGAVVLYRSYCHSILQGRNLNYKNVGLIFTKVVSIRKLPNQIKT